MPDCVTGAAVPSPVQQVLMYIFMRILYYSFLCHVIQNNGAAIHSHFRKIN